MKDSLHHERAFLVYEGLMGNVCLYCDALYLNHFQNLLVAENVVHMY